MDEENGVIKKKGTKAIEIKDPFDPELVIGHMVLWFKFLEMAGRLLLIIAYDLGEKHLARPSACRYLAELYLVEMKDGKLKSMDHLRSLPQTRSEEMAREAAESLARALTEGELKFHSEGSHQLLYISRGN